MIKIDSEVVFSINRGTSVVGRVIGIDGRKITIAYRSNVYIRDVEELG